MSDISSIEIHELNFQLWMADKPIEVSTTSGSIHTHDTNTGDHLDSFETVVEATFALLLKPLSV
jgi:hypothetical protein|tara:strand:- start:3135 stop:3326 length:192 start_codon:yes stop_codon:yes gene_type:complete